MTFVGLGTLACPLYTQCNLWLAVRIDQIIKLIPSQRNPGDGGPGSCLVILIPRGDWGGGI